MDLLGIGLSVLARYGKPVNKVLSYASARAIFLGQNRQLYSLDHEASDICSFLLTRREREE